MKTEKGETDSFHPKKENPSNNKESNDTSNYFVTSFNYKLSVCFQCIDTHTGGYNFLSVYGFGTFSFNFKQTSKVL